MNENLYTEKLVWFKQNEKPETVLLIADNQEFIKIIVAWTNLDVRRTDKPSGLSIESESEIWEWLWENSSFSRVELKEEIGIPFSEVALENKMKPLIGNRLIYLDGTVNSFIQRYLRERVIKLFEVKSKKSAKKS